MTRQPRPLHGNQRRPQDEVVDALERFEKDLAEEQRVPDAERILSRRLAPFLQALVALGIGVVVGTGSVLLGFIVFTKLLHL